jgi:hypothetical protein
MQSTCICLCAACVWHVLPPPSSTVCSRSVPTGRHTINKCVTRCAWASAGSVTGVGVEITYSSSPAASSQLVVLAPSPGGPAAVAGVRPGDVLESINGVPTQGLSLYEAGDLLQGEEGTEVTLVLRPGGGGSKKEVVLTRQKVAVRPVSSEVCSGVKPQALPPGKLSMCRRGGKPCGCPTAHPLPVPCPLALLACCQPHPQPSVYSPSNPAQPSKLDTRHGCYALGHQVCLVTSWVTSRWPPSTATPRRGWSARWRI